MIFVVIPFDMNVSCFGMVLNWEKVIPCGLVKFVLVAQYLRRFSKIYYTVKYR